MSTTNKTGRDDKAWELCLYVAGRTPISERAQDNLVRICEEYLEEDYQIEVIDLRETPERAEEAQIFALPTVVRRRPTPVKKLIGDLSEVERVIQGFELKSKINSKGD